MLIIIIIIIGLSVKSQRKNGVRSETTYVKGLNNDSVKGNVQDPLLMLNHWQVLKIEGTPFLGLIKTSLPKRNKI